jgi:hypothetical protein
MTHAGDLRECDERPAPPNMLAKLDDRVGAAERFPVCEKYAHLAEQHVLGEMEKGANPGRLQGNEKEAAAGEDALHAVSPSAAEFTIAVEENPAAEPRLFHFIRFCMD